MIASVKGLLSFCYRRVVPSSLRGPLWHAREAARSALLNGDVSGWRGYLAAARVHLGSPYAWARVGGMRLRVDLRDEGVGRPLFTNRAYEPAETRFVTAHLRPGMRFVDVGANIGYFSALASRIVGPKGRVLAFEPDPDNFDLLRTNRRVNQLSNVTLFNLALGDGPGQATLYRSRRNLGDHRLYAGDETRPGVRVPVKALDEVLALEGWDRVDFVKMDVQGYEHAVFRGMERILRASGPLIVLTEFWPAGITQAGGDPELLFRQFVRHGFHCSALVRGARHDGVDYDQVRRLLPSSAPDEADGAYLNLVLRR